MTYFTLSSCGARSRGRSPAVLTSFTSWEGKRRKKNTVEEKFQHNSTSKLYLKFTLLALHSVVIRLLLLSGLNPPRHSFSDSGIFFEDERFVNRQETTTKQSPPKREAVTRRWEKCTWVIWTTRGHFIIKAWGGGRGGGGGKQQMRCWACWHFLLFDYNKPFLWSVVSAHEKVTSRCWIEMIVIVQECKTK